MFYVGRRIPSILTYCIMEYTHHVIFLSIFVGTQIFEERVIVIIIGFGLYGTYMKIYAAILK